MDRLIWAAWRAFWVGLGASAVLIGQSLLDARSPPCPLLPPPRVTPARAPDLSREPLGSTCTPVVERVRGQS
jgi:hypothetical protein